MTTTTETAERTRPFRIAVDLDPELRRQLRTWCLNSGLPGATQAGVLRALAERLMSDPELSAALAADLAQK